jgi:16S rRNA processing protein RimM
MKGVGRMDRDKVCVGAIAGAFGVRGEVRLKSFCAEPEAIATYGPLTTEDGRAFTVTLGRPVTNGIAARLSGVATREAAEALRGSGSMSTARGCRRCRMTNSTMPI